MLKILITLDQTKNVANEHQMLLHVLRHIGWLVSLPIMQFFSHQFSAQTFPNFSITPDVNKMNTTCTPQLVNVFLTTHAVFNCNSFEHVTSKKISCVKKLLHIQIEHIQRYLKRCQTIFISLTSGVMVQFGVLPYFFITRKYCISSCMGKTIHFMNPCNKRNPVEWFLTTIGQLRDI